MGSQSHATSISSQQEETLLKRKNKKSHVTIEQQTILLRSLQQ